MQDPFVIVQHWWELLQKSQRSPSCASDTVPHDAVRIMTIHQAKGLEFRVVVLADTLTTGANETEDILFDPELGLAVGVRSQGISLCAFKSKSNVSEQFLLAIDAVRKRRRQRVHAELARVLYVAMTRARDHLYIMDAVPCQHSTAYVRKGSLQQLLRQAQQYDTATFDRLMPTVQLSVALENEKPTEKHDGQGHEHAVQQEERCVVNAQHVCVPPTPCEACAQGPVTHSCVGTLRLTPSQLAHACNQQGLQKTARSSLHAPHHEDPARLGSLTHALLAAVSLQLVPGRKLHARDVDSWLRCAVAAAEMQPNEPQAPQAVQLARRTLLGPFGQTLSQATWVNFEHAVAYKIQGVCQTTQTSWVFMMRRMQ